VGTAPRRIKETGIIGVVHFSSIAGVSVKVVVEKRCSVGRVMDDDLSSVSSVPFEGGLLR
jgi:hypothetical protein